jgi:hypothetical protein
VNQRTKLSRLRPQEDHVTNNFKSAKSAVRYARKIEQITGKRHLVFIVPLGTLARDLGFKFATCEESERTDYERGGAVFVDRLTPGKA